MMSCMMLIDSSGNTRPVGSPRVKSVQKAITVGCRETVDSLRVFHKAIASAVLRMARAAVESIHKKDARRCGLVGVTKMVEAVDSIDNPRSVSVELTAAAICAALFSSERREKT